MIREASVSDEDALWEMLTYAASMSGPIAESIAIAKANLYLGSYVRGFGVNGGDRGLVAESNGEIVATETEPELATGMRPAARGKGLGGTPTPRCASISACVHGRVEDESSLLQHDPRFLLKATGNTPYR